MNIIIGAGVSGLAFANFSKDNDYLILEADSEIGGYCKTVKKDGFVWDYSGHFFHFRHKWLEDYLCEKIEPSSILRCEKRSQIYYRDRYIDFPFQKNIHQLEKEELIDCLYDLFFSAGSNYDTFKQMLYSKFGKSIAEKFLIPYNEKLYACDLDLLDVNAMGRFFPYADKEDIIKNFKQTNNESYNSHFTYPKDGAIAYVNSLYSRLDANKLSLNERLVNIDLSRRVLTTNKRQLKYDKIISSMPFPTLLEACGIGYNKSFYSWNKVLVFNLGFDKKGEDTKNNWVYFPDKETTFYRIGYYDNIFDDDRMSLYVEIGFGKDVEDINVESYKQAVLRDLERNGIITDQKLIASHWVIMDPAYVHITDQSNADVAEKKKILADSGVYSIGRYGSWTYCSIEDNMIEAKDLAEQLS